MRGLIVIKIVFPGLETMGFVGYLVRIFLKLKVRANYKITDSKKKINLRTVVKLIEGYYFNINTVKKKRDISDHNRGMCIPKVSLPAVWKIFMKTAVMIALAITFLSRNEQILSSINNLSCIELICFISKLLIYNLPNDLNTLSIQLAAIYNRVLNKINTIN